MDESEFPLRSRCEGKSRKYTAAPIAVRTTGESHAIRIGFRFPLKRGFQPIFLSLYPESSVPRSGTNIIAIITS